jgi:hypothetical protein
LFGNYDLDIPKIALEGYLLCLLWQSVEGFIGLFGLEEDEC